MGFSFDSHICPYESAFVCVRERDIKTFRIKKTHPITLKLDLFNYNFEYLNIFFVKYYNTKSSFGLTPRII